MNTTTGTRTNGQRGKVDGVTRRRARWLLLVGAFLVVGASAPTACMPEQLGARTLTGVTTRGSYTTPKADQTCPLHAATPSSASYRGQRSVWTANVAASDPKEWLHIDMCLGAPAGSVGGEQLDPSPFVLYTKSGQLQGATRSGWMMVARYSFFDVQLVVNKGTGAYQSLKGTTFWYQGCYQGSTLRGATFGRSKRSGYPAACSTSGPSLSPTLGTASQMGRSMPVADPSCPASSPDGTSHGTAAWTARIGAADPKEWLRIDTCLWSPAHSGISLSVVPGDFTIYTATGNLTGAVSGGAVAGDGASLEEYGPFWIFLDVTDGTGAFSGANGSLVYLGCTQKGIPASAKLVKDPGAAWVQPVCA